MLSRFCTPEGKLTIGPKALLLLSLTAMLLFGGGMLSAGYYFGASTGVTTAQTPDTTTGEMAELQAWMAEERERLSAAQRDAEDNLDALAIRLAELQAHMMRINALGERLVKLADLDQREFDFSLSPATGGPDDGLAGATQSASDLVSGMDTLGRMVQERMEKLTLLEEWVINNEVKRQTLPSGLPVESGWVSSGFGGRINPVTGKVHLHAGVDIPGESGSDVLSVAAGVVTKAERMSGYGNMIEIRHADGYATRYAHNQKNLVQEGDRIEKGQVIALLGSSGRTTGPHVHFEVRKDGEAVNPQEYLETTH